MKINTMNSCKQIRHRGEALVSVPQPWTEFPCYKMAGKVMLSKLLGYNLANIHPYNVTQIKNYSRTRKHSLNENDTE